MLNNSQSIIVETPDPRLILITGATGYVGGCLLRVLEQRGYRIRCLARRPDFLKSKVAASTQVVKGDVLDCDSLQEAMREVKIAYYMIHSMDAKGSFEEYDRQAALNFSSIAKETGVERIIYLGGLGVKESASKHLLSRIETGEVLSKKNEINKNKDILKSKSI